MLIFRHVRTLDTTRKGKKRSYWLPVTNRCGCLPRNYIIPCQSSPTVHFALRTTARMSCPAIAAVKMLMRSSSKPSSVRSSSSVSSTCTTAVAPSGTGAPVVIRTATPGRTWRCSASACPVGKHVSHVVERHSTLFSVYLLLSFFSQCVCLSLPLSVSVPLRVSICLYLSVSTSLWPRLSLYLIYFHHSVTHPR